MYEMDMNFIYPSSECLRIFIFFFSSLSEELCLPEKGWQKKTCIKYEILWGTFTTHSPVTPGGRKLALVIRKPNVSLNQSEEEAFPTVSSRTIEIMKPDWSIQLGLADKEAWLPHPEAHADQEDWLSGLQGQYNFLFHWDFNFSIR